MLNDQPEGFAGELDTVAPTTRARAADRQDCGIGAGLRPRGVTGFPIRVLDLSTHGFRACSPSYLAPGADVWLRLPGLETLHARVAWADGYIVGCAFAQPLHPAVLQMMVAR